MPILSKNQPFDDLGGGFRDSSKDGIATSNIYKHSLQRDSRPHFSANAASPPRTALNRFEVLGEITKQDHIIDSNMHKLRPQPASPPHYQAHPYNLNTNSFPGKGNPGAHHVEMPTTEEPSGSSIGIGSMPGSNYEAGVATLPEEREDGKPFGTFRTGFEDYSPAKGGLHPKVNEGQECGNAIYKDSLADRHLVRELGHDHLATSKWEIPSTEVPGGSRQGVGSLPGNLDEAGVAMLPDEKKPCTSQTQTHPSTKKTRSIGGLGDLPGKPSEQRVALLPEERLHPADAILMSHLPPRMDQMPSMEHLSGSVIGVGSLPGERHESAVALTPEERLHPADAILSSHLPPRMDQMPSMEHLSGSAIGVGSLPGQRNEKGVAILPDERKTMEKPHRRLFSHRKPPPHDKPQAYVKQGDNVKMHEGEQKKKHFEAGGVAGGRAFSLN